MIVLSCNNVSKAYMVENIIENISFTVNDNEKVGLIGLNGAGKTTLFNILTENLEPDSGEIYVAKGKKLGYLKQNTIIEKEIEEEYELQMSFEEMAEVMKIVKQHKATLTQTSTADTLTLLVKTKKTFSDHFLKALTENYLLKEKVKIKALF